MARPAPGWVRISSSDPPLSVDARLSDARPNVEQGYGGWTEIARPRRTPLTTFTAAPGLHLTLPVLLDGWQTMSSVERQITAIERMAGLAAGNLPGAADGEPPQLKLTATGGAVPHQERTWVVDSLAWGDAIMDPASGNRVRQQVTLTLLEYREDVYLTMRSAANRRRAKAKRAKTLHGAKSKRIVAGRSGRQKPTKTKRSIEQEFGAGEDLLSIAARELGDADRWVEIAQLNGIRDPRSISPGQVLRLP